MTTANWTDPHFASVTRLLSGRTGLSFRPDDCDRVERGIRAAMQRAGQSDLVEYRHLLERDADVWDDLIVELTVGETYFFREPLQFAFMREEVLPDILRRREPDHTIRVWSAGCASGEEPYSLAIMLQQEKLLERSHILATDVSSAALAKARAAVYPDWSLRGQGAWQAKPYLERQAEVYVLDERIRGRVDFEMLNLAVDSYPSIVSGTRNLDLILCRNVLIYFDSATVKSIAERFHASLADGGWLITSSADPQLDNFAPFETVVRSSGVYYRRTTSVPATARQPAMPHATKASIQPHRNGDTSAPMDMTGERAHKNDAHTQPATGQVDPRVRPDDDALADARRALEEGRYAQAIELTADRTADHDACVIRVQALANVDIARAEHACTLATAQHPLSAHLHYLQAMLLLENNRGTEAAEAARRVIYLDRKLAIAHLLLGSSLRQAGDLAGALRAFRNAHNLCASQPPDEIVRFSDGETAGNLARAAEFQMQSIKAVTGAAR